MGLKGISTVGFSSLVSHTDFSSILQGVTSLHDTWSKDEVICWQIFRATAQVQTAMQRDGDAPRPPDKNTTLTTIHLLGTFQHVLGSRHWPGRRFSPGFTLGWWDTMAVCKYATLPYIFIYTVHVFNPSRRLCINICTQIWKPRPYLSVAVSLRLTSRPSFLRSTV